MRENLIIDDEFTIVNDLESGVALVSLYGDKIIRKATQLILTTGQGIIFQTLIGNSLIGRGSWRIMSSEGNASSLLGLEETNIIVVISKCQKVNLILF